MVRVSCDIFLAYSLCSLVICMLLFHSILYTAYHLVMLAIIPYVYPCYELHVFMACNILYPLFNDVSLVDVCMLAYYSLSCYVLTTLPYMIHSIG